MKRYIITNSGKFVEITQKTYNIPNEHGVDIFAHKERDVWQVTEGETGAAFGHGRTRKEATEHALSNLAHFGIEDVLKRISAILMQHGHTPGYRKTA